MRYLFVVAHPDDEALGAGAMICKIKELGGTVSVLTLSMSSPTRQEDLFERQAESHKILGVSHTINKSYETMKFGQYDRFQMVRDIEEAIAREEPDIIITHSPGDIHNDHKITAQITMEAVRLPQRQTYYDKPLTAFLHMEVLSSTDWNFGRSFSPNVFIGVEKKHLRRKIRAIGCYDDVLRSAPHPRNAESIYSLARVRGGESGEMYAEAFCCSYMNLRGISL